MRKALIAFSLTAIALADPLSMEQLMKDRQAQDGKVVTVTGLVKGYTEKDDSSSFLLMDGGKGCSVYAVGRKGLHNDQRVTVNGTFSLAKKLGTSNFSNVVEASDIQPAT